MKRMILVLLALLFLTGQVHAVDVQQSLWDSVGMEELENGVPPSVAPFLEEELLDSPSQLPGQAITIAEKAASLAGETLPSAATVMVRVAVILLLCQMVSLVGQEKHRGLVLLTGTAALITSCAADLKAMIDLGTETVEELMTFSDLLIPVMASAAAASGGAAGAAASYGVAVLFSSVLLRFCQNVLVPAVYALLALSVTDTVLGQDRMKRLRELLAWALQAGLKGVMYGFTGFLTMTGILSGTADAAVLKAAKTALSGMVPVVGGIISGAAETVLAGASILKGAAGTFGMLVVLAIFLYPFLRMGIYYLAFRLTSALCGMMGSSMTGLLETVAQALGFLLAMVAGSAVMVMICCCCFLKVVGT